MVGAALVEDVYCDWDWYCREEAKMLPCGKVAVCEETTDMVSIGIRLYCRIVFVAVQRSDW